MERIIFEIKDGNNSSTETLWAQRIRDGEYLIKNVPFYIKNISFDDLVSTLQINNNLYFKEVLRRGGHSTYRFILLSNVNQIDFDIFWKPIEQEGCSFEKATDHLYAIDVEPKADIYKVYALLESGEKNNIWGFEEGHCGHKSKNK